MIENNFYNKQKVNKILLIILGILIVISISYSFIFMFNSGNNNYNDGFNNSENTDNNDNNNNNNDENDNKNDNNVDNNDDNNDNNNDDNNDDNDNKNDDNESNENKYIFYLKGYVELVINLGETYKEEGFIAKTLQGTDLSKNVSISGNVDTKKIGDYQINYSLKTSDLKTINLVRKIHVIKQNSNNLSLKLNGESIVYIPRGYSYDEKGATAYFNNKNVSNEIKVTSNVDINKIGTYNVSYEIKKGDIIKNVSRKVVIFDLNGLIKYNTTKTNTNVKISINTNNYFQFVTLPNKTISKDSVISYEVSTNGNYTFAFTTIDGKSYTKTVTINNIDKVAPSGTCVATIYNTKSEIKVNATDSSGISKYIYNNKYSSTSSNYTVDSKLTQATVTIYDNVGNYKTINCQIKEYYIEMHFIAGDGVNDDAILIRTKDKTIMIDGGRWKNKDKVVSYLKKIGVKKINALIGSHVQWNHVQAQAYILDNFNVDKIYYSVNPLDCVSKNECKSDDVLYLKNKLKEKNITPIILKAKDSLQIGDMKLYFIGPVRDKLTTYQNANSLVFILQYGSRKYMFPGDTPSQFMDTAKFQTNSSYFNMNLDIDVLKWPHHGYEDLTDEFFKATTPKYAILPNCCTCNTSKYPSTINKNLMTKYGTTYYQVCDSKNIVLVSNGKSINIKTKQDPSNWKW